MYLLIHRLSLGVLSTDNTPHTDHHTKIKTILWDGAIMTGWIPDDEYKKILENMPICCVDLVVRRNNKVLLVFRANEPAKDKWWLPGGRVYKRETLEQAAARKVLEEAGLQVRVVRKIGAYETIFDKGPFDDLKTGVHNINVCFVVEPVDDRNVRLDKTSSRYRWIDRIEEDLDPYVKQVLSDSRVFG